MHRIAGSILYSDIVLKSADYHVGSSADSLSQGSLASAPGTLAIDSK